MKKILLVIPTITAYQTFLTELSNALLERGWDVHLATSNHSIQGFDVYNNHIPVTVHHIDFPRGANLYQHIKSAFTFRHLVNRIKPDLIHVHFSSSSFTVALAKSSDWPPTISTIQGLIFTQATRLRYCIYAFAESYIARKLNGTWVLTECDFNSLKKFSSGKVFLQKSPGFGCDLSKFDSVMYSNEFKSNLRQDLGISDSDFVFAFIGRQVDFKGFHIVIRAFLHSIKCVNNIKLLLIGVRDPIHPSGLNVNEEIELDSSPDIINVGWQANVAPYLAISNLNVFPSKREGMPVNLMESLSMGVPVLTYDSRGCRDLVHNNINGVVLNEYDFTVFSKVMIDLKSDIVRYSQLSANAIMNRKTFDRLGWVREQIDIYNSFFD